MQREDSDLADFSTLVGSFWKANAFERDPIGVEMSVLQILIAEYIPVSCLIGWKLYLYALFA